MPTLFTAHINRFTSLNKPIYFQNKSLYRNSNHTNSIFCVKFSTNLLLNHWRIIPNDKIIWLNEKTQFDNRMTSQMETKSLRGPLKSIFDEWISPSGIWDQSRSLGFAQVRRTIRKPAGALKMAGVGASTAITHRRARYVNSRPAEFNAKGWEGKICLIYGWWTSGNTSPSYNKPFIMSHFW